MKVIELLSSQLNREAFEHEIKAAEQIFTQNIDFWMLCVETRRILNEEKEIKNATS